MKHTKLALALVPLLAALAAPAQAGYILRQPLRVGLVPAAAPLTYSLAAFDQATGTPVAMGYNFGNVAVPQSDNGALRITNQGTGSVTLAGAALTGDAAITLGAGATPCAAALVLAPGASCYAYPTFTPATATGYSAQYAVSGDHGAAVTITLTGAGTTAAALNAFATNGAALTGAVGYTNLYVGQTSLPFAGIIRNTGTAPAELGARAMAPGSDPAFTLLTTGGTNNCSDATTLAVDASCNVFVSFVPSSTAPVTATYTIATVNGPSATFDLAGQGLALAPTLGSFSLAARLTDAGPFDLTAPGSNSNGTWSYSSSNPAVATVAEATVTLTGTAGTTTLTATQAASGNYSAASTAANLVVSAPTYVLGAFSTEHVALTVPVTYGDVYVNQSFAGEGYAGYIRNSGTGTAQLAVPVLSGNAAFHVLNTGGTANCAGVTSLGPNQFCNVYATFTPTVAGVANATYTLTTTSGGQAASIDLIGTGVIAEQTRTISANDVDVNMAAKFGNPTTAGTYVLTINPGVYVTASSTATAALTTGTFPAGSTVRIVNNGYILGAGGTGGVGALTYNVAGAAGGSGGLALDLVVSVTLDNTDGAVYGGGGGGGGGGMASAGIMGVIGGGGGGGGAGLVGGMGGTGHTPGASGGQLGGAGGLGRNWINMYYGGAGGTGGGYGLPGLAGQVGVSSLLVTAGGAGGAPGLAVRTNGNSLSWLGGNDAARVKGLVQ